MGPMKTLRGRSVVITALVAASSGLGGCGLLDGSSRAQDALEHLPADATMVTFTDRTAIAGRLGLDDLRTGASESDLTRWVDARTDEGYATELSNWVAVMQDASFSDFDVEWEARAHNDHGLVRVWKLRDDVDFDAVATDLQDAGYERSKDGDAEVFTADLGDTDSNGIIGGRYPSILLSLALVPDEHLVISGNIETGLAVTRDDEDSLADEGSFNDLLDLAPDEDGLEFAGMNIATGCAIDGTAVFAADEDDPVTGLRLFPNDDAAANDADTLGDFLETVAPNIGLDVDFTVEQDGEAVRADADFADRRSVVAAWLQADGPFSCETE